MTDHPDPGRHDPLQLLRIGHHLVQHITSQRPRQIRAALAAGHSWADVAQALDDTELGVFLDHHAATQPEGAQP